jgi:hypothetical protein
MQQVYLLTFCQRHHGRKTNSFTIPVYDYGIIKNGEQLCMRNGWD